MLDFYYHFEDTIPEYPIEENYLGSFKLEEFARLKDFSEFLKSKNLSLSFFNDCIILSNHHSFS